MTTVVERPRGGTRVDTRTPPAFGVLLLLLAAALLVNSLIGPLGLSWSTTRSPSPFRTS